MTILSLLDTDPVDLDDEQLVEAMSVVCDEQIAAYQRGAVETFAACDAYASWIEEELGNRIRARSFWSIEP